PRAERANNRLGSVLRLRNGGRLSIAGELPSQIVDVALDAAQPAGDQGDVDQHSHPHEGVGAGQKGGGGDALADARLLGQHGGGERGGEGGQDQQDLLHERASRASSWAISSSASATRAFSRRR